MFHMKRSLVKRNSCRKLTNSLMIVVIALFLLILPVLANIIEDFHALNCSSYDPEKRLQEAGDAGNCLSALRDPLYRNEFDKCKENICFLLNLEPPIVTYNPDVFHAEGNLKQMQLPFLCRNPRKRHRSFGGLAFNILQATSAKDEYCAWVGPLKSCTWNALVDYVAVMGEKEGYQFALVGPMLETPQRKCFHFESSSWWDGKMVVLGRNVRENMASVHPIWQLVSPFQRETWIVVGSVTVLFVIVCLMIVYRFHVFRGQSLITAVTAYFVVMGERTEALAIGRRRKTMTKGKGFATGFANVKIGDVKKGSLDGLETEMPSQYTRSDSDAWQEIEEYESKVEDETKRKEAFLTKFSLATSLFRISIIAFVAIFSLFYEVAVVNFLFQQQNLQITKDIEHLTLSELSRYSLVQDTAMEAIWNFRVNPRRTKFDESDRFQIPWKRCRTGPECFHWVLDENNPVQFYVTYNIEAIHLTEAEADCDLVTIFETKGTIHRFNSGWLFNAQVPTERRRKLDRELGGLKIKGTLSHLLGGRREGCAPTTISSITFVIILLPVSFLVLPPLLFSAMVALSWRRNNTTENNASTLLPE